MGVGWVVFNQLIHNMSWRIIRSREFGIWTLVDFLFLIIYKKKFDNKKKQEASRPESSAV